MVHRIAVLPATGECDPGKEVDRINNMRNIGLGKTDKTGIIGVSLKYTRTGKLRYPANIMVNYKSINLGIFDTIEAAAARGGKHKIRIPPQPWSINSLRATDC